jgi:glycosyltransferase involved in cell wall biosynthesis
VTASSQPLFSIIIPTFNCAPQCEKTLASVLSQKRDLFEVIVMDGGSTDGTVEVIRSKGDAVRWVSERDAGIYDAMNKGIAISTGRYLYFLGAGDTLHDDILERMAPQMPNAKYSFVYGDVFMQDLQIRHYGKVTKRKLRLLLNICHQSIFYERSIFDLLGKFETKYKMLADFAFNLRCFGDKRIQFYYRHELIADYEGGGSSIHIPDPTFMADFPRLLKENVGFPHYQIHRLRTITPAPLKHFLFRQYLALKKLRLGR